MTNQQASLGALIRESRLAKRYTLRQFAAEVDISSTYLSSIERDELPSPPSEETLTRIGIALDLEVGRLLALAGRIPSDLADIIKAGPIELATFLRTARDLTPAQLQELTRRADELKSKKRP